MEVPTGKEENRKVPVEDVPCEVVKPVEALEAVTEAPGTRPAEASETTPSIVSVGS